MKERHGTVRRYLGRLCQSLTWALQDPHDSWVIDYCNKEGHACAKVYRGFYSQARRAAAVVDGKIVGWRAVDIPADGTGARP